jgi:copper chaperone CopZ
MIRKTFTVAGMTCPNCAMNLEGMEDNIPGVQRVTARYRNGTVEIEFDEHKVDESELKLAISRLGYQVVEG